MNQTLTRCAAVMLSCAALIFSVCGCNRGGSSDKDGAPGFAAAGMGTPKVSVAKAVIQAVPQNEGYSSTVQAYATNNIAPQSGGRIKKINVEIGDYVSKGQVLAEMDRLQLDQTRLSMVNDSTELSRLKGLLDEGGISLSDYESMELAYKVRKSTYANLLENTILRAPITGVVTARNYDTGDLYGMAQPLFVVQQITPVKILVGISESDYTRVRKGDEVQITADALPGRTFKGKVNRIYPTVNALTHTVNVEVVVQNSGRELRPGMYAKVVVNFASRNSVVVPETALVKQQGSGQRIVYVLGADSTVEPRIVQMGRHLDGLYEILSGIQDGETVVVRGQTGLRGGMTVEVAGQ